jgi:transposase
VDFEFLLYDVTSTYFEGLAEGNEKAARGYSRDHRGECKQVCIGLVCTPEGLPLNFEVFAGNRTDVTTVGDMVRKMEERFGKAERVWVMDRGMVSEGNISLLSERKALYLVGTPKSHLRAYEAELVRDEEGRAIALELSCPMKEGEHPTLAKGAYLLRTNCTETDPAKLWRWYMQLTQAEAAFRTAKSDIGLRPVYHQKTERVEAHLLVCFLSLALWRTLEMWMNGKGLGSSARKLVEAVGTIRSMDLSVPVRRGNRTVKLNLRTVAKPDPDVALLLAHLGLRLPKGSRLVENVVEKTTP